MEVNRINNKEQILKNLQELDTKLENRQISRKEYKSIKKQYQDQLESVEVIERIRRMQGNTTPYSPETIHEYNSTETTKAHDKEILQKYINKPQPKTEILEQSQKDREEDKSLLNKYLKPEGEEVSEEKINRPKLNTPEDKALIKKFITDPTSKKEINSEKDTKEEPIINTKLKYVKSNKKSSNTSEEDDESKTTNDKKESIRSIISSFGNKTKSKEPPKEQEPIEKTQVINEPEPIKEIKEKPSEVKPIKNTDDVIEEKSTEDVKTINEKVKSEPIEETKSDIETETENTTQTSSESNDKKERPKLKESIIVNSEDILKPKKDKESIPINEVSSLLDSSSPKPKPKESINLSSKDVSDAISYAMGESTSIVNVENINETNDVNEKHIEEPKVSENQMAYDDTKESGIKSFFGFKVGQYANESEEKADNSKSSEINQNTPDVNSHKSVSDNVNDFILNTKNEENKTQNSKKDTNENTKNNEIQSSQTKEEIVNTTESTDSKEKTQTKTISSVKPVFAVKGKDKLLNSENLQTEDKSKLPLTKSISDFKKDKESKSKNVENKSKTNSKDNISSQTIYPTNQNKEKSESKTSKDSIKKPSTDDADERQKIIIGGILLGIILLILAVFGFNAYTSPENTKLYIDDTALAPNDTALTSNDTLNETATPSSTTTSITKSTTASATATATYTSTSLNKSKITNNIYKNNPFRNNYGYKYGYRYKYKYRNHTNPKPNHNGSDDPDSEDPSSDGPFDNLSTK